MLLKSLTRECVLLESNTVRLRGSYRVMTGADGWVGCPLTGKCSFYYDQRMDLQGISGNQATKHHRVGKQCVINS